jgi:protein-disulfide isomerase
MAKTSRRKARGPYRPDAPERGNAAGAQSGRQPARSSGRRGRERSGLPLLPITLTGLAVGLLVIAFFALGSNPPAGPLATPAASYPAENPDHSLGSLDAPVLLQEWADFQCPACKAYTQTVEPRVIDTYVNTAKVRIAFHNFAFIGDRRPDKSSPDESVLAATAALCAGAQGHFWVYHGYLYANQGGENSGTFTSARLDQIALAVGLDLTAFHTCLADPAQRKTVTTDTTTAEQAGIDRTPTLVVGNHAPITGVPAFDAFSAIIEAELVASGG